MVTGDFTNSGTITANQFTGMAIYSAKVNGALRNSGSITAATYGINVLNFYGRCRWGERCRRHYEQRVDCQ